MLSRREFIRRSILYALTIAGGSAVASCNQPTPPATPVPPTAVPLVTSTTAPAATTTQVARATMTATPIPPTAGQPYLVVARGANPAAITRAAIDALGGIGKFVKAGNDVIIKPNICNAQNTFEYASTTNPDVVAELVNLCIEAGAKRVRVLDQPFSGTAREAYKKAASATRLKKPAGRWRL